MRSFLTWLMRGRMPAMMVAAALVPLRPLDMFSGAVIALVVLTRGLPEGLLTLVGASAIAGVLGYVATGSASMLLQGVAGVWIVSVGLAWVLRRTGSLALSIQVASLVGVGIVVAFFVVLDDPAAFWTTLLKQNVVPLIRQVPADGGAQWDEAIHRLASLLTGVSAALMAFVSSLAVLIARWWQAILYNPGGFRVDFHRLRMGRIATGVASAAFLAGLLTPYSVLDNLAVVFLVMFIYQGLAVVHAVAARRQVSRVWLAGFYALCVVAFWPMLGVVAGSGFMDNWFDLRARFGGAK
jgi:hypothetical protein